MDWRRGSYFEIGTEDFRASEFSLIFEMIHFDVLEKLSINMLSETLRKKLKGQ
jgi:hypothetical protein